MERALCLCGSAPTHRCTMCSPRVMLCPNCLPTHASAFPEDSFQSLSSLSRSSPSKSSSSNPLCSNCQSASSNYLMVLPDSSSPICKPCKSLLRSEDHIFIQIKWKEIVSSTKELPEIQLRNQCLKQAYEDIDKSMNRQGTFEALEVLRADLINSINDWVNDQKSLISSKNKLEIDRLRDLKKELANQILKRKPESNTEAGNIIQSLLQFGQSNIRIPPPILIPTQDIVQSLKVYLESIKVAPNTSNHYIYLFHPGKSVASRIDLEKMKKKDLNFDRNWTFEASWLELDDFQVFFCGGNGMNNSEVLMIDFENSAIRSQKDFTGRSGHSIVQKDGFVYVFGGNKGKFAERFRPDSNSWEAIQDIPAKIPRVSACLTPAGIIMGGIECESLYIFNAETNRYDPLPLDLSRTKNKILFYHNEIVYCLCGDKIYYSSYMNLKTWESKDIIDRDWWCYSKPVIYENSAYFVKYFVRNLWCLNLESFELRETPISDIPFED